MTEDADFQAQIIASEKKEKRREFIIGVIMYGGFGLWMLYLYLTADSHKQESMGWFLLAGGAFYLIEKRLIAIQEKLARIEQRLFR